MSENLFHLPLRDLVLQHLLCKLCPEFTIGVEEGGEKRVTHIASSSTTEPAMEKSRRSSGTRRQHQAMANCRAEIVLIEALPGTSVGVPSADRLTEGHNTTVEPREGKEE